MTNGSGEPHKVSFDYGTRSQNFVVATGLPNSTFVAQLTTEGAGNLCVTTYSPTDLIVDVAGSLGGATTTAPHRVACSAPGPGNYVSGTQLRLRHRVDRRLRLRRRFPGCVVLDIRRSL